MKNQLTIYFTLIVIIVGCKQPARHTLFTAIESSQSNIHFVNAISENDSLNLITNEYTYMGGGVGIGDFNNDGLPDIFFSANQSSCKIFLNKGGMKFKDISATAGIQTQVWCTGVSIIDINNDGWLDIYVCVSGPVSLQLRKNLLFINNHNLTFTESAAAYGLTDSSYSTQSVFLDYDKDGLLDMFLLTHQMQGDNMNKVLVPDLTGYSPRNDKLFHNEGIDKAFTHAVYKEVTMQAGIRDDGYGLGVVVSDFNGDNWADIYVSNDYIGNDCLWVNNHDGTFSNSIKNSVNHQSYSSMGTDAGDINNDGLPDIITLDMMPADNQRQKMMYSFLTPERFEMEHRLGYQPSVMHNTLQLNRGNALVGDKVQPVFCDIAQYAGVAHTDWSWSVLIADFNNDGAKDIHITNGIGRDMINNDFIFFKAAVAVGPERNSVLTNKLNSLGTVPLPNYFFTNNENLSFTNTSGTSGINEKAVSNGAAYADLDNDGDLDLVVNNINSEAFLFINNTVQPNTAGVNYLSVVLQGPVSNLNGIGTTIKLFLKDTILLLEQNPVRGYLSTVDNRLFTGVGNVDMVDSVQVIWPNDSMQVITKVKANQSIIINYKNVHRLWHAAAPIAAIFTNNSHAANIYFKHTDPFFNDFGYQRLLPQKYSAQGPGIAVADINGDGLQDFFIGNGYENKGQLYFQNGNGTFTSKPLEKGDKFEEDTGCLFFDADADGDNDLLVTSGTNEFDANSIYNLPRLYLNDGQGNFKRNSAAIPSTVASITSVVKAADFDGDGDMDLFIGGRTAGTHFPEAPKSYLLQNEKGIFTDATQQYCPALSGAGMVTDTVWADVDGDNKSDLIICGEWMPIRFFKNTNTGFIEITNHTNLTNMNGLWRSITAADLDKDGDIDLVVGNLGQNNKFKPTEQEPLQMWWADIDGNAVDETVMGYYLPDQNGIKHLYPAIGLAELSSQAPAIKKKYLYYKDFSFATMQDLFAEKKDVKKIAVTNLSSYWLENKGAGKFEKQLLPVQAQLAPINCIIVHDFNSDGMADLMIAGNEYETEAGTGQYDASYGMILLGSKQKIFTPLSIQQSGIFIKGDVRCLQMITTQKNIGILTAVNNDSLQFFQLNK